MSPTENLKKAFKKMAATEALVPGRENVYPDVPEVEDKSGFSSGVLEASDASRRELVERGFKGVANSAAVEKALIRRNFGHAKDKHESHSLMLQKKASVPTMRECLTSIK